MDNIARVAYIQAMSACAIVDAIAILVERTAFRDGLDTTGGEQVRALIDRYGIHHNAVISYLGHN